MRSPPLTHGHVEWRQSAPVAELPGDLDGTTAADDAAPAQAALDPVDLLAREPRVRRAKVREEPGPLAAEPSEAEQREQRMPERRRPERRAALESDRHADGGEGRSECEPDRVDRRADDCDLVRRRSRTDMRERGLGDQLERPARSCPLEPADRPVERDVLRGVR